MIHAKRFAHVTFETPDLDRQIAYFTEVAGPVLAERENGRAYLATKLGDLVVQLEKGSNVGCRRLAFQAAPETDFNDIRKGIEVEGLRCQTRSDPAPGIGQMLSFEDPKGTVCELFSAQKSICKPQASPELGPSSLGILLSWFRSRRNTRIHSSPMLLNQAPSLERLHLRASAGAGVPINFAGKFGRRMNEPRCDTVSGLFVLSTPSRTFRRVRPVAAR